MFRVWTENLGRVGKSQTHVFLFWPWHAVKRNNLASLFFEKETLFFLLRRQNDIDKFATDLTPQYLTIHFEALVVTFVHYIWKQRLSMYFLRPKKKKKSIYVCVFQVSALKKLGIVGRHYHFIYQNILYRNCIFHYIFQHFSAYLTIVCSQFTLKCLGSGQKPRYGRETSKTNIFRG